MLRRTVWTCRDFENSPALKMLLHVYMKVSTSAVSFMEYTMSIQWGTYIVNIEKLYVFRSGTYKHT